MTDLILTMDNMLNMELYFISLINFCFGKLKFNKCFKKNTFLHFNINIK